MNLHTEDDGVLTHGNAAAHAVYDPTVGTGGMLLVASAYLLKHNRVWPWAPSDWTRSNSEVS